MARSSRRWLAAGIFTAGVAAAVTTTALAFAAAPPATGEETVTETIEVSGTFDGGNQRFIGGGDLGDGGTSCVASGVIEQ